MGLLDQNPAYYHQAKIVRKTLIPTALLLLFDFLSLKNYVNVRSKSNKQKNFFLFVFVGILKVNAGSGSISRRHRSADPDPRNSDLINLDIKENAKLIPKLVKSNISFITWNSHILSLVRYSH